MKKIFLILGLMLLLIGCKQTMEAETVTTEGSYFEGIAQVGNEIFITIDINLEWMDVLNRISYEDVELEIYEFKDGNEEAEIVTDLFEIDETRIKILNKEKSSTIDIPTTILKEGRGIIKVIFDKKIIGKKEWDVVVETEGYINPEIPQFPTNCKNLPSEMGCIPEDEEIINEVTDDISITEENKEIINSTDNITEGII